MLYLGNSLVDSEKGFYQEKGGPMMNLDMTRLTITTVVLKNKKGVAIGRNTQKYCSKCGVGPQDHCF